MKTKADDEETTIIAQGSLLGQPSYICRVCGRSLSNHVSVQTGIGPICRINTGAPEISKMEAQKHDNDPDSLRTDHIITDKRVDYQPWVGNQSYCRLRVYQMPETTTKVVVLSEMPGNPGMSVTNWAESLATQILNEERLEPGNTIWIEHYPPANYATKDQESLTLINHHWTLVGSKASSWKAIQQSPGNLYEHLWLKERNRRSEKQYNSALAAWLLGESNTFPTALDSMLDEAGMATLDGKSIEDLDAWDLFSGDDNA